MVGARMAAGLVGRSEGEGLHAKGDVGALSFLCSAGKERALVISNHRSDIDWLVGWIIAQRLGCLGGTRAVMKKSTKFLPVIGWSMWFSEYVFLSRNWTKDEKVLKNGYSSLKGFPRTL